LTTTMPKYKGQRDDPNLVPIVLEVCLLQKVLPTLTSIF